MKPWMLVGLVVVAAGLVARGLAPPLLEHYVDRVLDRTQGYAGRVGDVDLALWRGGYRISRLELDAADGEALRPLLRAEDVDVTMHWSWLLRGALVGEIDASRVVYNVVAAPPRDSALLAQTGEEPELGERLSELFPFSIDRLEIVDGALHYRDPHRSPRVDIAFRDAHLLARNWTNVRRRGVDRFGRAWLRARAFRSARVVASLSADPLTTPPDFVLALRSEGIELAELNDFLRAYGGFDVADGRLDLYLEVEATDGRFDGYLKTIVRRLDVLAEEQRSDDWADRVWEGVVGAIAEVFENQLADRQATRIPIEGTWEEPAPALDDAIANVLYNAFIEALPPRLENPERLSGTP